MYIPRALLPFLLRLLAKHHDHSVQKARRKRTWSSHDGDEAFSEEQEMEVSDKDVDSGEETSSKRKREDSVREDLSDLPAKRKRNDDSRLALDESGDAMELLTDLSDDDAAEKDSFTIEEEGNGEEELNAMLHGPRPTAEGADFDPLVRPTPL